MSANKVKFGLKNVHYAPVTFATDGSPSFGAPVSIPGAVSLSLEPQGDNNNFYADDIVYFTTTSNAGYEGDLEIALLPDHFRKTILKEDTDGKGVQYEKADAVTQPFALLFEVNGDQRKTRHVFYNNVAKRTSEGGSTRQDTTEPKTETLSLNSSSVFVPGIDEDIVKAKTTEETNQEIYNNWYKEVYIPGTTTSTSSASGDESSED